MSGRSILNQSITGRNILNIKTKNLQDGKAIKISDRHAIDVDMKSNTTEQTSIADDDLFLLSDTTGKTIKYITGSNLSAAVTGDIVAGANLTKTGSTIDLDTALTSMLSINGFTLVSNISSAASQFLLKDNSVGSFPTDSFLTTNASGLIAPKTEASVITAVQNKIAAGINIVRSIGLNSIMTLALSNALINMASVNGYVFNTTTNSTVNQFLLKDTTVGAFASGDFLTINSSNKVDNISRIDLNNSIVSQVFVTNGLSRTLITDNGYSSISISTTPSINLSDTMTLLNTSSGVAPPNNGGHAILKIEAGGSASFKPQIHFFQSTTLRTILEYDKANNKFLMNAPTGLIELSGYNGTSQILAGSQNVEIKTGGNLIFKIQPTQVDINRKTVIQPTSDIYTNDEFMLHVKPFQGKDCRVCIESDMSNSGGESHNPSLIFKQDGGGIKMEQGINAANQFYFFHPQSSATWSRFRFHCGSAATDSNGQPTDASLRLSIEKDKIDMLEKLELNNNQINFQTGTANHYIKYSSDEMDGVEVVGYGAGASAVFRVACSNGSPQTKVLEVEQDQILFYKSLVFPSLGGGTDFSSLKYASNKHLTISFEETGEFRWDKSGSSHNYFKTIAQGGGTNGRTFFFEQGGDSGSSNGGAFQTQNSQGKMLFQSDRNLVIYRPDGSVSYASGGNASSRDYKTNINDLVETDSVDIIKQINPVSYEYKEEYWDSVDECDACNCNLRKGFIWEDIKPILPQTAKSINMNNPDMETTKLLDTKEIIPDLTKTVQFLLAKVEAQDVKIATLTRQLETLLVAQQ